MRIAAIDIVRGLCIVLVVFGHNPVFSDSVLDTMLSTVRMPLMFFIAGAFLNTRMSWRDMLIDKADALLKPFVVMALLQAPLRLMLGHTSPEALTAGVLAGGGAYLVWIFPLWYLTHLWWVFAAGHALVVRGQFHRWSAPVQVLFLLGCFALGHTLNAQHWLSDMPATQAPTEAHWRGVPFQLDQLPCNLVFFLLGQRCQALLRHWQFSAWRLIGSSALFLATYTLAHGLPGTPIAEPSPSPWSVLVPLAGMAMLVTVATGLAHLPLLRSGLAQCGRDSLFILLFHSPLQTLSFQLWSMALPHSPWLCGTLGWASSLGLSLGLAHVIRQHHWIALLWLPRRQVQARRTAPGVRLPGLTSFVPPKPGAHSS
ncbi:MAG TPA: acyltransferase [Aquabacterium sp.]|uniref:acyltransferase family protein n=1 Tax=Aquabacterium sp. TaxID=1872578 RepID=UPI002DA54774|nr:acyltransferase [Aquabacterium sp.]HET6786543.1 acyltransferase [Aquabacterium sp.]HEX5373796.1 acyltransferase [Aquabacterium sp.]